MPIQKPTKPSNLVPRAFGGVKNNFSDDLQSTGFEPNVPQTYNGDNINYHLDATGKELDYVEKVVDYINQMPVGSSLYVNANNQLDYIDVGSFADKADKADTYTKSEANNTFVNVAGDTMTGDLKIAKDDYSRIILQSITADRDVAPSTNAGTAGFLISDKNGNTIAAFSNERYTDGRNVAKVQAVGKDGTTATLRVTANADGTQSCEFPKCTTKATTSSSATNTRVAVIVQNYVNGYAWMRKWSDGWIEQGGRMTVSYEQTVTTNFVTSFSNTNYYVTASPLNWQNIDDNVNVTGLTTNSCVLYGTGIGNAGNWGTVTAVWYACGY